MAKQEYLLSVDTGTSVTKAILYDIYLNQVSIVRRHYQQFTPHSGWSEQDPDTLFHYVLEAIREALQDLPAEGKLAGIVFSSQMYSVLAISPQGRPLTRSLTWSDTRAAEYARQLASLPEAEQVFQATGCPVDTLYPLAKIAWIKDNIPLPAEVRFISIKEYIVYKLTGRFITDWSVASSSGLMDIHLHQWHPQALAMAGIGPENLSELARPASCWASGKRRSLKNLVSPREHPSSWVGGMDRWPAWEWEPLHRMLSPSMWVPVQRHAASFYSRLSIPAAACGLTPSMKACGSWVG